jgi:hypothetical protein
LTSSKTVATWTGGVTGLNQWRGAIITPDGRTVLGIEQLAGMNLKGPIREHLVSWSTTTGQQIAVLNNLNARKLGDYEQILYTNADGRVLVLTYQQPGAKAAIGARRPVHPHPVVPAHRGGRLVGTPWQGDHRTDAPPDLAPARRGRCLQAAGQARGAVRHARHGPSRRRSAHRRGRGATTRPCCARTTSLRWC